MKKVVALLVAVVLLLSSTLASSECVVLGSDGLLPFYANFPLIAEGKVLEVATKPLREYELDSLPLRLTRFQITTYLKTPRNPGKYEPSSTKLPRDVYWMLMQDRDLRVGEKLLIFATLETATSAYISINDFPAGRNQIWVADNGSCHCSVYKLESPEATKLRRKLIKRLKKGLL